MAGSFLSARSALSGTQKKLAAIIAASAPRSFRCATSASRLRKASKLASFMGGGRVMDTAWYGPSADVGGGGAGGSVWARPGSGTTAVASANAATRNAVERKRECRINLSWMQSNHMWGANDRTYAPLAPTSTGGRSRRSSMHHSSMSTRLAHTTVCEWQRFADQIKGVLAPTGLPTNGTTAGST